MTFAGGCFILFQLFISVCFNPRSVKNIHEKRRNLKEKSIFFINTEIHPFLIFI